jgi:hypothetical protein
MTGFCVAAGFSPPFVDDGGLKPTATQNLLSNPASFMNYG